MAAPASLFGSSSSVGAYFGTCGDSLGQLAAACTLPRRDRRSRQGEAGQDVVTRLATAVKHLHSCLRGWTKRALKLGLVEAESGARRTTPMLARRAGPVPGERKVGTRPRRHPGSAAHAARREHRGNRRSSWQWSAKMANADVHRHDAPDASSLVIVSTPRAGRAACTRSRDAARPGPY